MSSDGTFTYVSEAGETDATDTFDYTISDGSLTGVGTVTITFGDTIWFIDNSVTGGGNDGRSNSPFESISAFNGATTGTGDTIFLFSGTYTDDGIDLEDSQILVGEESGLTSGNLSIASGTAPELAPATDNGINLASGNTVRGLDIGDTAAGHALSGGAVGTLTVSDVAVSGSGGIIEVTTSGVLSGVTFDSIGSTSTQAASGDAGIDLTGITGTFGVGGSTISGSDGSGISISGSSAVFSFGATTVESSGAAGIDVSGSTGGSVSFTDTDTVRGSGAQGILLTNNTGSFSVTGATTTGDALNGNTGIDIEINGAVGGGGITFGTVTVNNLSAAGIDIDGGDETISFGSTTVNNQIGANVEGINVRNTASGGSVTFAGGTVAMNGGTDHGVDLRDNIGTFTFTTVDIDDVGGANHGIFLSGNTGTMSISGGTIDGVGGDGINALNSALSVGSATPTGVTFGGGTAITGDGIDVSNSGTTSPSVNIRNSTASSTTAVAGVGIRISSTGAGTLSVTATGNDLGATSEALLATSGSNADSLRVALGDNEWRRGTAGFAVDITGSADGALFITSLADGGTGDTATANGTSGGVQFDTVTFDATPGGAIQQVAGGSTNIGQGTPAAQRVQGDGLELLCPEGDVSFTTLNVFNNNGDGIEVNTKAALCGTATTFTLGTGAGTIDTTNGTALDRSPPA